MNFSLRAYKTIAIKLQLTTERHHVYHVMINHLKFSFNKLSFFPFTLTLSLIFPFPFPFRFFSFPFLSLPFPSLPFFPFLFFIRLLRISLDAELTVFRHVDQHFRTFKRVGIIYASKIQLEIWSVSWKFCDVWKIRSFF
ncbi:hypothetical protein RCL_jg19770.t1 [Rhizophagus clarus]|uniref:Uncharacterized protein n=1 Tax=Rhizophagus clarus TaxID=94130 RepID=A0A8H3M8Y6_9GLOM|nr:hypothetical protein RCL_jg19770.t1 [Rhizophagus clarus]